MDVTGVQKATFVKTIVSWDTDKLINYFAMCVSNNQKMDRYEEIAIVRAEIVSRMK